MSIATEEKSERYPWGEVNTKPVKICCPEEITPLIERLHIIGNQMEKITCGLYSLHTRLFAGGEDAKNFEYERGTGSADDAVNSIMQLVDSSIAVLEAIHTKL